MEANKKGGGAKAHSLKSAKTADTKSVNEKLKALDLKPCWATMEKQYDLQEKVGSGSFGQVVKGVCRDTGVQVAIKLIDDFSKYEYDCVKVVREIKILRGIHANSKNGVCCFVPEIIDAVIPDGENA